MLRAEVRDIGPCNVGTACKAVPTLHAARSFIEQTSRESWAGEWRIIHAATGTTVLKGANERHRPNDVPGPVRA